MIDIHTHIIPGIDDGAEDMFDSLQMAELAVESGVSTIIATPHCNTEDLFENYYDESFERKYRQFCQEIERKGIPLKILRGMEIYITEDVLDRFHRNQVLSLNDSGYHLVEFGFHQSSKWMTEQLEKLRREGIGLIVAHPERYDAVQRDPELVMDWTDMGCQIQVNRGSFFGRFGRSAYEVADELLTNGCLTYIASDAHSPYHRTTFMQDIFDMISMEYSRTLANRVLRENQERYLLNVPGK